MAHVIRHFDYSRVAGRGRGILGFNEFSPCRKPGQKNDNPKPTTGFSTKVVIALYKYESQPNNPGGFPELSIEKGQILELLREHPDNEHWWEVRNEDGNTGFVPSSYVIIKDEQVLPWLQASALKSEEQERKERAKRLAQQKAADEGVGFGPAPKDSGASLPLRPYVSAYNREENKAYYCEVCDKQLNGPKPYQAHMVSKAHKEELALLES